jgi:hypothetical protein
MSFNPAPYTNLDERKNSRSEVDSNDPNGSLNFLARANSKDFSFKGSGSIGSNSSKDLTSPSIKTPVDTSTKSFSSKNLLPPAKPSPFLLEKRNSEKNLIRKGLVIAVSEESNNLEKTAMFFESSINTSKRTENAESFMNDKPKLEETSQTPGVKDKIKKAGSISQPEEG